MTAPVGADIESLCSKCGDVWHVVVAKVGERIVKVMCKQCQGQHRYKPPGGAPAARGASTPAARGASGSATRSAAPRRAAAAPPPPPTPLVPPDLSRPVRPYRATEAFRPGDRITHSNFGSGVVEAAAGPGRIQVFFPGGRKVLAVAKAESTLEPRSPSRADD
jgi:hypothetical protein